jgi:hypothetical protein
MGEYRPVRRNAQVTQDREVESAGVGDPVNGRDHRQREPVHRVMEQIRGPPEPFDVTRVGPGEFPQIEACAEAAAAPCDDQDFDRRIVREPGEDGDGFSRSAIDSAFILSGRLSVRTTTPSPSGPLASTGGPGWSSVMVPVYHRS